MQVRRRVSSVLLESHGGSEKTHVEQMKSKSADWTISNSDGTAPKRCRSSLGPIITLQHMKDSKRNTTLYGKIEILLMKKNDYCRQSPKP